MSRSWLSSKDLPDPVKKLAMTVEQQPALELFSQTLLAFQPN
jgi:hypothetical protein